MVFVIVVVSSLKTESFINNLLHVCHLKRERLVFKLQSKGIIFTLWPKVCTQKHYTTAKTQYFPLYVEPYFTNRHSGFWKARQKNIKTRTFFQGRLPSVIKRQYLQRFCVPATCP